MVLVASLVSHSSLSWSSTKVSENMESILVHSRMLPFCFLQRGVVAVAILTTLVVQSVSPEMASETPRSESCRRRPRSLPSFHSAPPEACHIQFNLFTTSLLTVGGILLMLCENVSDSGQPFILYCFQFPVRLTSGVTDLQRSLHCLTLWWNPQSS